MIFVLILLIILAISCIGLSEASKDKDLTIFFSVCAGIIITLCVPVMVSLIEGPKPSAIDVYQGKTTLQITYEDSIPIDTVVVFKPEFRK